MHHLRDSNRWGETENSYLFSVINFNNTNSKTILFQGDSWIESISEIKILFPDPWPKKKHYNRRLIQNEFIEIIHQIIKPSWVYFLCPIPFLPFVECFRSTTFQKTRHWRGTCHSARGAVVSENFAAALAERWHPLLEPTIW